MLIIKIYTTYILVKYNFKFGLREFRSYFSNKSAYTALYNLVQ